MLVVISKYMQSKSCDASPAVSAHAHVITDAVARDLSSCVLRAFKRSQNVWPSVCRTVAKPRNIHWHFLCLFSTLINDWIIYSQNSFHPRTVLLSVQHQIIQISTIIQHKVDFKQTKIRIDCRPDTGIVLQV